MLEFLLIARFQFLYLIPMGKYIFLTGIVTVNQSLPPSLKPIPEQHNHLLLRNIVSSTSFFPQGIFDS